MIGWLFLSAVTGILVWLATRLGRGTLPPHAQRWAAGVLGSLWVVTAGVMVIRFARGMGAMTHLSDRFPWGVWVGLLQAGAALSAGGFVMAATVHVFRIHRFEPLLRPLVLLAFLGYNFVALTLFIEVGRPWALWHPLAMWQHHSIMFEVAWCVTLYLAVLAVEFSPVLLEKMGHHRLAKFMHGVAVPVVIAGVVLSVLHQSSLGSMFLIVPQKIHPLWSSTLLPVHFLVSAMAAGICVTLAVTTYMSKVFRFSWPTGLAKDLGRAGVLILAILFTLRLVDVSARGSWATLFSPLWLGILFLFELIGGVALPAVFLWKATRRGGPESMAWACLPAIGGVILNRINVSWFSMVPYYRAGYFPHWMELAVSLSLFTFLATLFVLAVRFLPVFSFYPLATNKNR